MSHRLEENQLVLRHNYEKDRPRLNFLVRVAVESQVTVPPLANTH
jgi:hypothetical protein